MFFPSRGPDFPKKIIFQKKRRKKASEYLEVKIFYLPLHSQSGNNGLHEEGSIAQLVQSVCLTSRGSGVRIPVLPQRNGLRYKSQPVSAFTTVARSRTTALRYGIPYTLLPYALLLRHERIFAPNERIAPFPNFPQPMFERPTPSCKHTHKSTSLLEAPPADARQNRRKDRIHAKASPNIRCPKTRPKLDGLCKPEENKGSIRPEEQNVHAPSLRIPVRYPAGVSSLVVRNPERSKNVSAIEGLQLLDSRYAQSFHPGARPASGKRTFRAALLYPITPRTRSSKADKAAFAPSPIATTICL